MSDSTLSRTDHAHRTLERIAAVLGCPVEAFHAPDAEPDDLSCIGELLRLWAAIGSEAGRQAVLEYAQAVVRTQRP